MTDKTNKKHARASLTDLLTGICERLDANSAGTIDRTVYGEKQSLGFKVRQLFVVGSYAKGALECGDLDLVFNARAAKFSHDLSLKQSDIRKHFYPGNKVVSGYIGEVDCNTSGLVFTEAVEIWNDKGRDWKKSIASIKVDPDYFRKQRASERMPVDMTRVGSYPVFAEVLENLKNMGLIDWEFISTDAKAAVLNTQSGLFLKPCGRPKDMAIHFMNNTCKKALPVLETVAKQLETGTGEKFVFTNNGRQGQGLLGNKSTWLSVNYTDAQDVLKMLLTHRQVGVTPIVQVSKTNGVWLFKRGLSFDMLEFTKLVKTNFEKLLEETESQAC